MTQQHTITLCYEDMVNFVTGNGQVAVEEIGQEVVDSEIKRYCKQLKEKMGESFEVVTSTRVLETKIDGHSARYDDDLGQIVSEAEAQVVERFW